MSASVTARNVSKTFMLAERGGGHVSLLEALRAGKPHIVQRRVDALKSISLDIGRGERVGIIGRNGAGKTTLLSLISGIAEPTSGSIEVVGDLHAMLSIGAVLREESTGRENIYLDGAVHGRTHAEMEALAGDIIAFSELGDFIDRQVRTYSSGMKARLAFSMGAFIKADILIIDETLSVGDATFARKATRRMKEMTQQGQIVILVSHSLGAVVDMCNRCLWLDDGCLVMDGSPDQVTRAYLDDVEMADGQELIRKFSAAPDLEIRDAAGALSSIALHQSGKPAGTTVKAFVATEIRLSGSIALPAPELDLILTILRVDGRKLWTQRLSSHHPSKLGEGPFRLTIAMDPFVLGDDLYQLEALLMRGDIPQSRAALIFEVRDEEGQFGGKPSLFYPLTVSAKAEKGS